MKKKNFFLRLYLMYIIALIPLVAFGIYKNGIELYTKDLVGIYGLLKPCILLLVGVLGAALGGSIRECIKKTKLDKNMLDKLKCDIVEALLVVAVLPLGTNPLIIFITAFAFSLLLSKLHINRIALMYIVIEGINVLLGRNDFNNIYEVSTALNYDGFDLFFGNGVGGIFSTNVCLIIVGLIFLSFNKLYKKEMLISSLITFLLLGTVPSMVMGKYQSIFPFIFSYNFLFIFVFIAPNLYSSSYTTKGQIASGILIAILTYALSFLRPYTAGMLAVVIVSILRGLLDKIFVLKN